MIDPAKGKRHAAGRHHGWRRQTVAVVAAVGIATALIALPQNALAHGFAGKRFFPATLVTDDPFVAAEATPLQVDHMKQAGGDRVTNFSTDFTPLITPRFAISIGETYTHLNPVEGPDQNGFDNLELGGKYLLGVSERHEALLSIGIDAEIGDTGSQSIGAESRSAISPDLFFGKGFGDLPEALRYLKPVAVTGVVSPDFTVGRSGVQSLSYGFAVEYNLQYLQSFVQDVGLAGPLEHIIPVVEAPLSTCTRDCDGGSATTGTINPGLIYTSHYGQVGFEAAIPINHASGSSVGGVLQLHLYLDDVLADVRGFGRPLLP